MGKALLFLACSSLVIVAIGTALSPNSPLFMLASNGGIYQYVREALAATLLLQFVTHPPRHLTFRLLAGALAIGVAGWALIATYNGQMLFLDTLSLLASAAAIGVTALEVKTKHIARMNRRGQRQSNPLIA